ncbi:hypothetical protein [Marinicella rhabdoformis]|uniref:hypothetical protein n=1 Tax=Marinicella rhabdoformis TaxID=2580566 RepID=UPI0012AEC44E|nr:hypothetical protein [Marinicella rhabdoformis]
MNKTVLNLLIKNKKKLGLIAIAISILTWFLEFYGVVYVCPYCRTQRTIIGLLGLSLLLPNTRNWLNLYVATTLAIFGFFVASYQHFEGWKKIMSGKFIWGEQWYLNSWLLSGFALFIISGLLLLIWTSVKTIDTNSKLSQ